MAIRRNRVLSGAQSPDAAETSAPTPGADAVDAPAQDAGAVEASPDAPGAPPQRRLVRRPGEASSGEGASGDNPPLSRPAATRGPDERPGVMIPARSGRPPAEAILMRIVATAGIVGIGAAIAAIMASQHVQGWLIGVVVSTVSVILAAVLWSSRRL